MHGSSLPRYTGTIADQVMSSDGKARAIERAFVFRLVTRLGTEEQSAAKRVESMVETLDSGEVDASITQFAPPPEDLANERFVDIPEFNYDKWRKRHS